VNRVRRSLVVALIATGIFVSTESYAIRPFVTDDARVVGGKYLQLETWFRRDRASLQHWMLFAFGPNDHMELTLGGVHGAGGLGERPRYGYGGPLAQAKILLNHALPNDWPGVALSVGALPPFGSGGLETPGWGTFAYLALTEALVGQDVVLIHLNAGYAAVDAPPIAPLRVTWGVGTQVHTIQNLHAIGELFSGDPYAPRAAGACQLGFRYIFSDYLQLDATYGQGLFGERMPFWISTGVRMVSHELW
jgi:hypothetical protein